MDDSLQGSFAEMLEPRSRRLAGRLEGFGDIVFGFAVSQCALELPTDNGHVDLSHPFALLYYFGTFAIIVSLWLIFHRLMSGTFMPTGIDLTVAFTYLALVSLIPFAMYALSRRDVGENAAKTAFVEYAVLYGAATALAASLSLRNLRRGWWYTQSEERRRVWRMFVRLSIVSAFMWLGCVIDLGFGPSIAGLSLLLIPIGFRVARLPFAALPSASALRIAPSVVGEP